MARQPGMMTRGRRWYLRARVPPDLVEVLGRQEVWRSLRTGEHGLALRRYRVARVELDEYFERVRRARRGLPAGDEVRELVAGWLRDQDRAAAEADLRVFGDELRLAGLEAEVDLDRLRHGHDDDVGASVQAAVDELLVAAGWPSAPHRVGPIRTRRRVAQVDRSAPEHAQLRELVRRAMVEGGRRRLERLHGRHPGPLDPLFERRAPRDGLRLSELIERHAADRPRSAKKALEYGLVHRLLREVWGDDKPVREVTRADCRAIRDLLAALPANATKRWSKLTLVQAAERAGREGVEPMRPATANAHLGRLSTMLRWAKREQYADHNHAEALTVAEPEGDPRDARHPFSADQLARIFGALGGFDGARRWVPLLGLLTGMRLNEICQLGVEDVAAEHGVSVIRVRGRLKTRSARRVVPVHPELVRLGFLDFVARQREAGQDRLFPELRLDRRGYYSDRMQKWFSRFLEGAGAKTPRTSFHSFRHSFTDALRRAGATADVIDDLCGWSRENMRDRYGSGPWIRTLADAVERVDYPGLNLSHVYPRRGPCNDCRVLPSLNEPETPGSYPPGHAMAAKGDPRR